MDKIRANRDEILKIVEANRAEHRHIFEEAVKGYRDKAVELLDQRIEEIRHGKAPLLVFPISPPQDHTRDYDRIIRMLQLSQDEVIEMDEQHVQWYVEDDWHWTRQFLETSSVFSARARGKNAEMYGEENEPPSPRGVGRPMKF